MCGGKEHAPKICANVVSVFACQATDDEILSGEEEEAFIYDILEKFQMERDEGAMC